jgi:hypothetical protein
MKSQLLKKRCRPLSSTNGDIYVYRRQEEGMYMIEVVRHNNNGGK